MVDETKEGIKHMATEFLSGTTAHGLPRVIGSRSHSRRISWAVIFIATFTGFTITTYNTLNHYYSYPVSVKTAIVPSKELQFPAVTVCNMNMLRASLLNGTKYENLLTVDNKFRDPDYWKQLNPKSSGTLAGDLIDVIGDYFNVGEDDYDLDDNYGGGDKDDQDEKESLHKDNSFGGIANKNVYGKFLNASRTADLSDLIGVLKPTKSELQTLGHTVNDFILQCSFDKISCNFEDFYQFQNAFYGNCYTFNHINHDKDMRTTKNSGSRYGLRLTLNVQTNDYIGMFSPTVGARVTVHPADITPYPQDDGIQVMPGTETSIGLTMERVKRLRHPYPSKCSNGLNADGEQIPIDNEIGEFSYSMLACRLTCLETKLYGRCKCHDKVAADESISRCNILNASQERCRQKTYFLFNELKLGCDCPQPCNETIFKKTISSANWPSEQYKNLLRRNIAHDIVNDAYTNLLRVHVYYENTDVHLVEEVASYTEEQLAANIGGYLGLFIGLSICTAFEFCEFLFDSITYVCRKKLIWWRMKVGDDNDIAKE